MPIIIMWRTTPHEATICRVEVTKVLPRWVWRKHPWGVRKERKETLYHRYHDTFDGAKRYLKAEFEIAQKQAKERVEKLEAMLGAIEKLNEP